MPVDRTKGANNLSAEKKRPKRGGANFFKRDTHCQPKITEYFFKESCQRPESVPIALSELEFARSDEHIVESDRHDVRRLNEYENREECEATSSQASSFTVRVGLSDETKVAMARLRAMPVRSFNTQEIVERFPHKESKLVPSL